MLVIGSIAIAVIVIGGIIVGVALWRRGAPPSPIGETNQPPTALQPTSPPAGARTFTVPELPEIKNPPPDRYEPGLDRPLTAEENARYGWGPDSGVWIRTFAGADGTTGVDLYFKNPPPEPADADNDGLTDG